jgi:hypothetical protein
MPQPTPAAVLVAIHKTAELEKLLTGQLDFTKDPPCLSDLKIELTRLVEEIPVSFGGQPKTSAKFFVVLGGCWVPCTEGVEITDETDNLFGGLRWKNAEGYSGVARAREWAHATPTGDIDYRGLTTV